MDQRETALLRHRRRRWQRCDAHRWVRPDAAKFLRPGTDPADVYPALARAPEARQTERDRDIAGAIAHERAMLDALRAELDEVNAELAARHEREEQKYSESQPRVPVGNGRQSGRWSDASYGNGARPRVVIDTTTGDGDAGASDDAGTDGGSDSSDSNDSDAGSGASLSAFDLGDVSSEIDSLGLFTIAPRDNTVSGGVQLAGDIPDSGGPEPDNRPPNVPQQKPRRSADRTRHLRALSNWLRNQSGLVGDLLAGAMNHIDWINDYADALDASRDPAQELDTLQRNVADPQLEDLSVDRLVELFSKIGIAQDEALLGSERGKFNRLFQQMKDVSDELKCRGGDQRRALMSLYTHPTMQVRLKAAVHTLAVAPSEARLQLQAIIASRWMPQAGDAGMCLDGIDSGQFKPT